jgi:hypothetical protein
VNAASGTEQTRQSMTEIRWHARGGQGAVTAAKMVAEPALGQGKYFQAFPEYGPQRSGAPIVAFTRVSDEPIQLYCGIEHPPFPMSPSQQRPVRKGPLALMGQQRSRP